MFGYIFLVLFDDFELKYCVSDCYCYVKVFSTSCGLKNEVHTLVFNNKNM